jgi:hypothetical protein
VTPAEAVATSRAAQGLPPTVEDDAALAALAAIVAPAIRATTANHTPKKH